MSARIDTNETVQLLDDLGRVEPPGRREAAAYLRRVNAYCPRTLAKMLDNRRDPSGDKLFGSKIVGVHATRRFARSWRHEDSLELSLMVERGSLFTWTFVGTEQVRWTGAGVGLGEIYWCDVRRHRRLIQCVIHHRQYAHRMEVCCRAMKFARVRRS